MMDSFAVEITFDIAVRRSQGKVKNCCLDEQERRPLTLQLKQSDICAIDGCLKSHVDVWEILESEFDDAIEQRRLVDGF